MSPYWRVHDRFFPKYFRQFFNTTPYDSRLKGGKAKEQSGAYIRNGVLG